MPVVASARCVAENWALNICMARLIDKNTRPPAVAVG